MDRSRHRNDADIGALGTGRLANAMATGSFVPSPSPARPAGGLLLGLPSGLAALAAVGAALALTLIAEVPWSVAPPAATARGTAVAVLAPRVDAPESPRLVEIETFALNALLVPLLDDSSPPRWIDPTDAQALSLAIQCGSADVTVDGHLLVAGAAVPASAFTLRWRMNRCSLLNGAATLTGDLELLVFHDGDRYSASALPDALRVVSDAGSERLTERFSASMPLLPWTAP